MFPLKSIHTDGIRAGVMVCTIQLKAEIRTYRPITPVVICFRSSRWHSPHHPSRYLFGALELTYYKNYKGRHRLRSLQSYNAMSNMMIKNSLVKIKEHPSYPGDMEGKVLLNLMARAIYDPKTGEYSFKGKLANHVSSDVSNVSSLILSQQAESGTLSVSALTKVC